MKSEEILKKLPYSKPFLFVDEIVTLNEKGVKGNFIFNENMDFFKGHFKWFTIKWLVPYQTLIIKGKFGTFCSIFWTL